MKLVFFSDIHGNHFAFNKFISIMESINPDKIFFLGDIFGYYYGQEEIINTTRRKGITAILGNHDKYFLDLVDGNEELTNLTQKYGSSYSNALENISDSNISWLRGISSSLHFNIDGISFSLYHGSPDNPLNGRIYPDTVCPTNEKFTSSDFIVLGHTHHQIIKKVFSTIILNPGSLGQQRDGKGCSYLLFDTETKDFFWDYVEYDVSLLENEIDQHDKEITINRRLKEVLRRKVIDNK